MYNYEELKPKLFSEEGFKLIESVRRNIAAVTKERDFFLMEEATHGIVGSNWEAMSAVDFLKEQRNFYEISGQDCEGQHRTFKILK